MCYQSGSHSGIAHPKQNLHQTYQIQIRKLETILNASLNEKQSTIKQQLRIVQEMMNNIKHNRLAIEIESRKDMDGILQRLKDEQNRKLSILNVELHNLNQFMIEIEHIQKRSTELKSNDNSNNNGNEVKDNDAATTDPIPSPNPKNSPTEDEIEIRFLTDFDHLLERAHILSSKQIKHEYNIDCGDFPTETSARKQMLNNYNELLNDHQLKDEFIDYLLAERLRLQTRISEQNNDVLQIEQSSKQEMKHWMQLTDRFVASLNSFKLKCEYCQMPLHPQSINTYCQLNMNNIQQRQQTNSNSNSNSESKKETEFTESQTKSDQAFGAQGSGLHYFVPF
jgi:hypothetical protein